RCRRWRRSARTRTAGSSEPAAPLTCSDVCSRVSSPQRVRLERLSNLFLVLVFLLPLILLARHPVDDLRRAGEHVTLLPGEFREPLVQPCLARGDVRLDVRAPLLGDLDDGLPAVTGMRSTADVADLLGCSDHPGHGWWLDNLLGRELTWGERATLVQTEQCGKLG